MGPTRFPHNNAVCKICKQTILYIERKRCIWCGDWIHNWCGKETNSQKYLHLRRTECHECVSPSNMDLIVAIINTLDKKWDPETYKSGVIFLASLYVGTDEAKIAELTKYSPEEIKIRGDRLRENNVWIGDQIALDGNPNNDPTLDATILFLNILCADGVVKRVKDGNIQNDIG